MQIFGLISLLFVVAIGATWMVSSMGPVTESSEDGSPTKTTYQEAIDSANEIAEIAENRNPIPTIGNVVIIYDDIAFSDSVTVVDLSGRGLSGSLKAEVRNLNKLETLDLSDNNFTGLPAEVGQLSKLETLNLSNNPLTGLPHELGNLQNLKTLDLSGTQYSNFDLDNIKQNLPSGVHILVD